LEFAVKRHSQRTTPVFQSCRRMLPLSQFGQLFFRGSNPLGERFQGQWRHNVLSKDAGPAKQRSRFRFTNSLTSAVAAVRLPCLTEFASCLPLESFDYFLECHAVSFDVGPFVFLEGKRLPCHRVKGVPVLPRLRAATIQIVSQPITLLRQRAH